MMNNHKTKFFKGTAYLCTESVSMSFTVGNFYLCCKTGSSGELGLVDNSGIPVYTRLVYSTFVQGPTYVKKKLNIPWDYISLEYKWAAMDRDGKIYLYRQKPRILDGNIFVDYIGNHQRLADYIVVDTAGVYWETSRTKRT